MYGTKEAALFKRILIVCIGNICRSPTAEHLLRVALAPTDIVVSSAGLSAVKSKPIGGGNHNQSAAVGGFKGSGQCGLVTLHNQQSIFRTFKSSGFNFFAAQSQSQTFQTGAVGISQQGRLFLQLVQRFRRAAERNGRQHHENCFLFSHDLFLVICPA